MQIYQTFILFLQFLICFEWLAYIIEDSISNDIESIDRRRSFAKSHLSEMLSLSKSANKSTQSKTKMFIVANANESK